MLANTSKILFLFISIAIVYMLGTGIDIMDVDAAQYASMSVEMLEKKSFLQLYDFNNDYLDKPPMVFWLSSLSIYFLGASNFAYKLPSLLFAIFSIYATYKLALLYYKKEIALLAAIVLATSQALFLITQDCRTDTLLMGWVALALWQLAAWFKYYKPFNFILAFIFIGGGFLTKGPIALLVPAFAFGSNFILQRNFKKLFRWEYLLGLLIVGIMLIPFCIGLYEQFDQHPEKIIYGKTGTSGIRFFLWVQSFGRITGESTWNNGADIFFQLLNLTWGLLPWFIFFIIALFYEVKTLVIKKFRVARNKEFIAAGGFILTYFCVGASKYQLPHYIYVALPLAAIFTAKFIYETIYEGRHPKLYRFLYPLHIILFSLLWVTAFIINTYVFPGNVLSTGILIAGSIAFILFAIIRSGATPKLISLSLITIIGINVFMSTHFYPNLLNYQSGSFVGRFVEKEKIPESDFFVYNINASHSLCFYSGRIVSSVDSVNQLRAGQYLLTDLEGIKQLQKSNKLSYQLKFKGASFPVTSLTPSFLNKETRAGTVKNYYVVQTEAITDSIK